MYQKSKISGFWLFTMLILLACESVFAGEETTVLKLTVPKKAVCCCTAEAIAYWEMEGAKIHDFATGRRENQCAPVVLSWECSLPNVKEFQVQYGLQANFSNALTVSVPADKRDVELWNLFRGKTYYWSVTAVPMEAKAGIHAVSASGTFKTRGDMPRTILVDGIHNVRDLGGFITVSGRRVRQGLLFRGSEMNGSHGIQISEAGIRTMTEELAIRTDLDFRSQKEALEITESPLGEGVNLVFQPIGSYLWAFDHPESYRTVFSLLADEKNYPIYFHCWGGADRTGTVAFFVNALLGVAEEDLFRDFEFTSFSVFGIRNRHAGDSLSISETYEQLKTYPGATLAEKTENFMLSIGVTAEEIQALRRNLLEEE